ncbi:NAD(P)-binding protein [Penicillium waksmanii]|uniref:NAD(P)-binding protein n=1 Tax=Penicillium waksmanii TaxID=69791 RepID=UPI00254712D2|nr:NAD(P)-binding protein [Penicillium waksmanii]KAJ5966268.1 NAD(P)-binding protein [Penicillium waksmanii]
MNPVNSLESTLKESYNYGSSCITSSRCENSQRAFLFGYPIAHSMAPLLHATLFKGVSLPWEYSLLETQDSSEFLPALKQQNVIGCAVTMPYKVTMMSAVDEVTDEGRIIGAINTVFLRKSADGSTKYIGTNTDCIGVREAFLQNCPGIVSKSTGNPGLVIGGGGACRAAIYALWKWMGVKEIYVVNRLESEIRAIIDSFKATDFGGELIWVSSVNQAAALEAPVLVVGTVPDFPPKEEGEILARNIVQTFLDKEEKGYILEMCYHPRPHTAFFNLGERAGWKMLCGTESMIWQGVAQQILWTELALEKFNLDGAARVITESLDKH